MISIMVSGLVLEVTQRAVDSTEEVLLDGGLKMPAYSIAFLTGK